MEIRLTNPSDLDQILDIYESARKYMQAQGNPDQWVDGYPDAETILSDIENGHHFVCVEGNRMLGCFAFIEGDDPTYREIVKGEWLDDQPYAVIHRIAVLEPGRGIGSICIEWCMGRCGSIRIDTHPDNISMQKLLVKNDFTHCGMIYNLWGAERLAFQRIDQSYQH